LKPPGLIFGSVCSGIEAASCAWEPLGWRASFLSEISAFPRAVLRQRWQGTKLHGDFTKIESGSVETIDLLVGGTPCQSFSLAGLRGGLDDSRGVLALEFLKLAQRLRPRWLVWENVAGVLSSGGGRDFGSIVGGMVECGYGVAWRVLDAQFFGVPQRRRRVFLVGYLGDWRRASAVLFDRASLSGNFEARRQEGSRLTTALEASVGGASGKEGRGLIGPDDISAAVTSKWAKGTGGPAGDECQNLITVGALDAKGGQNTGQDAYQGKLLPVAFTSNDYGDDAREDLAPTLRAGSNRPGVNPNGGAIPAIAFPIQAIGKRTGEKNDDPKMGVGIGGEGDPMFTLQAGAQHGVAVAQNQRGEIRLGETTGALTSGGGSPGQGYQATLQKMAVRKLTPLECERLQGFPDDYTRIYFNRSYDNDTLRYKALGNSMAVPVMRWIGDRIAHVDALGSNGPPI